MKKMAVLLSLTMILLMVTLVGVQATEGLFRSQASESRVGAGIVIDGDKFLGGTQVSSEGEIKGDLVMAGQNAAMQGIVGGDLLAVGSDLSVSGKISGSLRSASGNLLLSGEVGRNLTSFSGTATLAENSVVNGSLYLLADSALLQGNVMGKTWVAASTVTLSGTFQGDVTIAAMQKGRETSTKLIVMPGTVIKGTLHYSGAEAPVLPAGASVGKMNFTKVEPANNTDRRSIFGWKQIVRSLLTVLLLYLIALLLLKLFPGFFTRPAGYLRQSPFSAAGIGIAALGVFVAAVIMSLLFTIVAIFLFKPVVIFMVSLLLTTLIVIMGAFSVLPVSLWIGNLLTGDRGGVPGALAAGLACLTFIRLLLTFLAGLPFVGVGFAVILGLFGFAVWLLGTGAILYTVKLYHESAARGLAPMEDPPQISGSINTGMQ